MGNGLSLKWIGGIMKIRINTAKRRPICFLRVWTNTLASLGLLSGNFERDCRVIGDIIEYPDVIFLDCPDLPSEALEVLKEYFKPNNINVYEE